MKSGVPWSVKGVEPDAREAAKSKARRAGLTLGAWLNQVIRDSGGTEVSEAEIARWVEEEAEAAPVSELGAIIGRLDALENRQREANREIEHALETLAVRIARTPAPRAAEPDKTTLERLARLEAESQKRVERLSRELGMLANRYSDIEAKQEQGHQEVAEALERIASRPPSQAAESPALARIQAALGQMEGKLEAVSRDSRDAASTFQYALKAVMDRVATSEKRQQEQARSFEGALEGLARQLHEGLERENAQETEAVQRFETAVADITEHFETIEKRRERGSRAVEDAIKNLTERLSESDRRNAEQVHAPLAQLDSTLQRVTQRIEEFEARTQGAVSALDKRLQGSDSQIDKKLQSADAATKSALVKVEDRLAQSDALVHGARADIDETLAAVEARSQETLAAIDNRLSDIAERIDQNDTEQRASRLALMRAIDDTRKRVASIEDRPVPDYTRAPAPPPLEPEAFEEAEEADNAEMLQPDFSDIIEETRARLEPEAETPAEEEPLHRRLYGQDSEVEVEHATVEEAIEEPPPFKTSEPVWALLAAARAAARAEAAQRDAQARETVTPRLDEERRLDTDAFRPIRAEPLPRKKRKKSSWGGAFALSLLVLLLAGASAFYIVKISPSDSTGRPSFFRSLIDELAARMPRGNPQNEAARPAPPVHVAQGAPAPQLPEAKTVPSRRVAAQPPTPIPTPAPKPGIAAEKPPPDQLALNNPNANIPAPPATTGGDVALSEQAIAAMRTAQTDEERTNALQLLTKAAASGNADAQFTLGRVYETGRGVKSDLTAARHWYGEAAGQGHAAAAFNLGMLEAQSGTREGYGHAARWFDQAARRGLMDAQFNLGMLYSQGLGISRDPVEAFAWFSAAAAQGDAGAAAERDRIGQSLDDAARARGEALARERTAQSKPEGNRG
jgi:localization factor PodJL